MFLRGGGGLIKVKGGGGGWWETRYIYHTTRNSQFSTEVLHSSVDDRDCKSTIANNSTGHPLGGSRWLELSVYALPPASTTI